MSRYYHKTKQESVFRLRWFVFIFLVLIISSCSRQVNKITIVETTDLHGVIFPYDFIESEPLNASLANTSSFLKQLRKEGQVVLLDNGDNLQGQPAVYYYNFIDTSSAHIQSEVMNYLGYDAGTAGNHDFEAGHSVYDRLVKEYRFPLLAANAVDARTGNPYFKPFAIIEKKGIKVAVIGLVTPSIPEWLPPALYSGIEFRDMVGTARKWMDEVRKEKPDVVIGLFHSGWNKEEFENRKEEFLTEDGSAAVAYNVPGFDIIFNGHDHKLANEKLVNSKGDTVLMLNGGSRSQYLASAGVTFKKGGKKIEGKIIKVSDYQPDPDFMNRFSSQEQAVKEYVEKQIGTSTATMASRDAYFGPSAFVDMVHAVQLDITKADISFTAPLSFDVKIDAGPVTVSDMFKLYRFENLLYTVSLTGEEIKRYLEYSYDLWLNTMDSPDDMMLKLRKGKDGKPLLTDGKAWLANQAYNFDSATGIDYIVDVSRKAGERVTITGLSDGRKFDPSAMYKVAVNSYRGSGGGGHLTEGAGLSAGELRSRMLASTEKDLRYYILKYIEEKGTINPDTFGNWKIIPESWAKKASSREYKLLFGEYQKMSEQ